MVLSLYVQKSEMTLMNNIRSCAGTSAMLISMHGVHRDQEACVEDKSFWEMSSGIFSGVKPAVFTHAKNTMVQRGE